MQYISVYPDKKIRPIMTTFVLFLTYAIIYYSCQTPNTIIDLEASTIISWEEVIFIFFITSFNLSFIHTYNAVYNLGAMKRFTCHAGTTKKMVFNLEVTYYLGVLFGLQYSVTRLFGDHYFYNGIDIVNLYNNICLYSVICYWCAHFIIYFFFDEWYLK